MGRDQTLVSKYERGLVEPPADVVMQCVHITRGDAEAVMSAKELGKLISDRLAAPECTKLRAAIAAIVESAPGAKGRAGG